MTLHSEALFVQERVFLVSLTGSPRFSTNRFELRASGRQIAK
ncbi:hypothetical protein [Sinorhizobium psoraleae]|nr:hypothetical protein [Sinorhizobium psoraleae]